MYLNNGASNMTIKRNIFAFLLTISLVLSVFISTSSLAIVSKSYDKVSKELSKIVVSSTPTTIPTSTPAKYNAYTFYNVNKIKPALPPAANPYINAEKGIYVRCYDNSIKKVSTPQEATNYNCEKKGGVYEYKTIQ
ncbi:MAG: hypothetical protein ACI9QD_001180 [Thermoproteota archaeon]|jgi:hypothetical protein